jgi:proline dehydrogenase
MKNAIVSFDNTEVAFSGKSDADLRRAYWLFRMIGINFLVKIAPPFVDAALALHLPIQGLIRSTIFKHFCGGESVDDCEQTIQKLAKYHIGAILDYSVEGKETEEDFDHALQETLATIQHAKTDKRIPFSVFKTTGFARMALLEKVNAGETLTPDEEAEFERVKKRVLTICQAGFDHHVPIYIDAEDFSVQDVIDELATDMMKRFNKESVRIYNTLQMYRTDRFAYLQESYRHAMENNYRLGVKIVRGAYMERERKRAASLGIPSPIHPDKAASDKAYDDAIRFCVEHIDSIAICAGTHNEESSLLLTELMQEKNLPPNHPHIWFSQLLGMSDHISYNLSRLNYNVTKYVPYGPVASVLPYLIRRAQENTSVAGQTSRELGLIMQEMQRRKSGRGQKQ